MIGFVDTESRVRICNMSAEDIRQRAERSNRDSYEATAKYICWEQRALRSDYEFIDCPCASECWCRRWGCLGHYRIKEISFDQFLTTYVSLWIPQNARKNVTSAVLEGRPFGGRQRNAVPALHWLRQNWASSLGSARDSGRCGLCDSAFSLDYRVANLYEAKMWSQLFYDALAPFDTASKLKIRRAGYRDRFFRDERGPFLRSSEVRGGA